MRNTFDIVDLLYGFLIADTDITGAISGGIYKHNRPLNSDKEDVVIGSLPVNNDQLQQTVPNINIHVPNLKLTKGTIQDNTQPDTKRLKTLTALLVTKLDDKTFDDYWFEVQQQTLFSDEETNEHYSNIRLNFYSINI